MQGQSAGELRIRPLGSAFPSRLFYVFGALVLLSLAISIAGRWLGRELALGGHTDDETVYEIVIGNNVLSVKANAIRSDHARRDGIAARLDLYLHWPEMSGYTAANRDDFNHLAQERRLLFLTFEPKVMSRDMSGRYEPIYRSLIEPGEPGPGQVTLHAFKPGSGYLNEVLAVSAAADRPPLVARCLTGPGAEEALAPCERDIHLGDELSLTYRFPRELLAQWPTVEAAVLRKADEYLRHAE